MGIKIKPGQGKAAERELWIFCAAYPVNQIGAENGVNCCMIDCLTFHGAFNPKNQESAILHIKAASTCQKQAGTIKNQCFGTDSGS